MSVVYWKECLGKRRYVVYAELVCRTKRACALGSHTEQFEFEVDPSLCPTYKMSSFLCPKALSIYLNFPSLERMRQLFSRTWTDTQETFLDEQWREERIGAGAAGGEPQAVFQVHGYKRPMVAVHWWGQRAWMELRKFKASNHTFWWSQRGGGVSLLNNPVSICGGVCCVQTPCLRGGRSW